MRAEGDSGGEYRDMRMESRRMPGYRFEEVDDNKNEVENEAKIEKEMDQT